jgi:ankyrin repeat protein
VRARDTSYTPDSHGESPLHLALLPGQVDAARMLRQPSTMMGLHPVLVPCTMRLRGIARIMPEHGGNVHCKNKNGLAPFGLASQGRLAEVIRVLAQPGANSGGHDNVRWMAWRRSRRPYRVRDFPHFTICSLIPVALDLYQSFLPYYIFPYSPPTRNICRSTIRFRLLLVRVS